MSMEQTIHAVLTAIIILLVIYIEIVKVKYRRAMRQLMDTRKALVDVDEQSYQQGVRHGEQNAQTQTPP